MRVDLRVPFSDRREARAAGARWDAASGSWWTSRENLSRCRRWLAKPDPQPTGGYERLACGCMRVFPWLRCKHNTP